MSGEHPARDDESQPALARGRDPRAAAIGQVVISTEKATSFIPFSIEIGQDWGALQTEMARLLSDAKDVLEATKFAVRAVIAHHAIERGDSLERQSRRIPGLRVVCGVERQTYRQAHVDLRELVLFRPNLRRVQGQ